MQFELVLSRNEAFASQNSKPKNRVYGQPKTGFSVLKKLRVTRFFGFGKNRVGNPNLERHLTQISRSRQYSTLNMALTVQDRHILRPTMDT